jgi:hypothetical protein
MQVAQIDQANFITERLAEVLNHRPKLMLPSFVRRVSIALAKIAAGGLVICATSFLIAVAGLFLVVGIDAVELVRNRVTESIGVVISVGPTLDSRVDAE